MARINYYRFPEDVDVRTRLANCADGLGESSCSIAPAHYAASDTPSFGCPSFDGEIGCVDCSGLVYESAEDTISGISVTRAKQLLGEFGGAAWTQHIDRDGGVFESTEIRLDKNNSRHKYNRHL